MALVRRLVALPRETEWLEFKQNFFDPDDIGRYVSALSNGAALNHQDKGYLVWGVEDSTHEITGTTFDPFKKKVGNEDFIAWLTRSIHPQVHIEFHELEIAGKRLVLLEVDATHSAPVRFHDFEWIRVGSYTKKLRDYPDHSRRLWQILDRTPFERRIAAGDFNSSDVLDLIDYTSYFRLMKKRLPDNAHGLLDNLKAEDIIREDAESGNWSITNLGAIMFAKDISDFPSLERKALRIIQYHGKGRVDTLREQVGVRGYASGFTGAVQFLNNLLPSNEVIGTALRDDVRVFPELAMRELLANALIHQDFTQTGNGPMVELFDGRIEITSPGRPLIDPSRFVDAPPKSRNEAIAWMMRRAGICEERGSGWDKVAAQIELYQLPAPLVELPEASTRVTVFGPKKLADMDKEERVRAVYLHACLRFVMRETLTNSSVRERFKIARQNSALASRLIGEAVEAGVIVAFDPRAGRKYMQYVPEWAADPSRDSL